MFNSDTLLRGVDNNQIHLETNLYNMITFKVEIEGGYVWKYKVDVV